MIRVYCPYFSETSFARQSRYFLTALSKYHEIALFPTDYNITHKIDHTQTAKMLQNQIQTSDDDLSVGIGHISSMGNVKGRKRIGFVVWETTRVPKAAPPVLTGMDEVWTASEWGRSILVENGLVGNKTKVIPLGVDPCVFRPLPGFDIECMQKRFRFLCVGKWETRKGIDDLIRAFCEEFKPNENVELVLHCHNRYIRGFDTHSKFLSLDLPPHAPIVVSQPLPEQGLIRLYNQCDAFVLPTKAEGWGLPIIEAMACSLPVIVTAYSALTEYVSTENGYLITVSQMVKACDDFAYYGQDFGYWAQPDVSHLKALMRHVFENPEEAKEKGRHARQDIMNKWTWDHSARKASEHLSIPAK